MIMKFLRIKFLCHSGDCSAHFLLDSKGEVFNAFFMDGGVSTTDFKASDAIASALKAFDTKFGPKWKFSSWVVTHWDADHFYGLIELFFKDKKRAQLNRKFEDYFESKSRLYYGGSKSDVKVNLGRVGLSQTDDNHVEDLLV